MNSQESAQVLTEEIRVISAAKGFDAIGFANASEFPDYRQSDSIRRDPKISLPDAQTIVVVGVYIGGFALPSWGEPTSGRTSRLFLSGFFNDVVNELEPIKAFLEEKGYAAIICDDGKENGSVVPLKLAAIRAGLGWQGKNTLLVSRDYGTFLALGGILTNAILTHCVIHEVNHCRSCDKCQKACPVGAIAHAHALDRSKCLSYLLQNENLPETAKELAGNRVMDCEICQDVCPWNSKHIRTPLSTKATIAFEKRIRSWDSFFGLAQLSKLTEGEYMARIGRLRTGIPYSIFRRNVGNAAEKVVGLDKTDSRI